jgi:hypothetical protein
MRELLLMPKTTGSYGLVTVTNPDGSLNRQYKVSKKELARVQRHRWWWKVLWFLGRDRPKGVTREEWRSGRAILHGKDLRVGDYDLNRDGSLLIKFGDRVREDGYIAESFLRVDPADWNQDPERITVRSHALKNLPIHEIRNGVLVLVGDPA